jgi:hypothetical protein
MEFWGKSSRHMTTFSKHPFYRQLIAFTASGFEMLDKPSQREVKQFVESRQDSSGGFLDRGGKADPYYSLFGAFLAEGTTMSILLPPLRSYVHNLSEIRNQSLINLCCLALTDKISGGAGWSGFRHVARILKGFIAGAGGINRSYQYFMVFLVIDAFGFNNRLTRFMVRPFFRRQTTVSDLPCPVLAAIMVLKAYLDLNIENELHQLMGFFDDNQGFKAISGAPAADLLSTAVALVAMNRVGADLRMVRPACLSLVERNFDSGAFMAGNGDRERDTEYTFYGLTALGLLK